MFNLLIGGAAGQGIETTGNVIHKMLKRSGYNVFVTKDLMSRVRGGHNFSLFRIGAEPVLTHDHGIDAIIAVNDETVDLHVSKLREGGFILADESEASEDARLIKVPMKETAKAVKNPKVQSTVAVGAFTALLGLPLSALTEVLSETIKPAYLDINITAAEAGYNTIRPEQAVQLPHSDQDYSDWLVLNGNDAIGLGALAAGVNYYSAYPMSPSTSIMEYLASVAEEAGIVVEQAEDEIAGINMAIGASYAGAIAMTGTSGGGYALKVEGMAMAGVIEVPVVTALAMRPGPVTGLPTRTEQGDLEMAIFAGNGEYPKAVIAIKTHEDAFYQAARAHRIAQKYQMPVVLLIDQYLADGTATVKPFDLDRVEVPEIAATLEEALAYRQEGDHQRSDVKSGEIMQSDLAQHEFKRYRDTETGISPRLIPGNPEAFVSADTDEHDEYGFITEDDEVRIQQMDKRARKLDTFRREDIQEPEQVGTAGARTLIVAWGSLYGAVKEATSILREEGLELSALVFGDVWPLPVETLKQEAETAERVINVEQNFSGQLGNLIRRETGIGMADSVLKYDGRPISAKEIADALRARLAQ